MQGSPTSGCRRVYISSLFIFLCIFRKFFQGAMRIQGRDKMCIRDSICTYPLFVETVKEALSAQEVKIASVAGGFPSSQTFMEIKIAETAMAVMQGADEIDVVMNLGYFLEENYDELSEEIQEIKESCRDAKLKVILETGALQTPESIQKAAVLAVYSGADFIKTSTGKGYRCV